MKLELQLAASLFTPKITPLTNSIPTRDRAADSIASRKELRVRTDALIADGQIELVQAVERACEVMLSVGVILLKHGVEPHVGHLIEASIASVENGRAVMLTGLTNDSEETIGCGAVMLELAVRGLLAATGVPYDHVLVEVHRARLAGEAPQVRALLEAHGVLTPQQPEAENDGTN